ncbi:MAG: TetR/AcrR family transcriptional regulator [Oscillospiraceae bacterium]
MAAPRKDNVKTIIMDATERLMATTSLSGISLASIANEAGVSKGTLYYHYKAKDDILFDITDRYLDAQWDDLQRWTSDEHKDTSFSRLVRYVADRNVAFVETRMHLLYGAMLGNEALRDKLNRRYSEFASLLSEKIAQRTDTLPADYLAWLVLLACDGLIVQKALHGDLSIGDFVDFSAECIKKLL